jgi:hypothetical protein
LSNCQEKDPHFANYGGNPDQSFSRQVQITLQQIETEALRIGSFP